MQDLFAMPSCFTSGEKLSEDLIPAAATKSRQSVVISVYRTKVAGRRRLITVTWCKNLLAHSLSVSIEGSEDGTKCSSDSQKDRTYANNTNSSKQYNYKVQISPWLLWRKHGSNRFQIEGKMVEVYWDLNSSKFCNEPAPQSDYYVVVVSEGEVVLLLGDLKKEAYRRTGSRPSLVEAMLVSKTEHVFGKKRFSTRSKFHEKGKCHEISVECSNSSSMDLDMVIKIDGNVAVHVRHLQWKFRGNDSISINKQRVEVYWDAHDWLFSHGLRHALFIFKPDPSATSSSNSSRASEQSAGKEADSCGFCLFLYAWKVD